MENAVFWEKMYAANIGRMIGLCHRYVNDLPLAEDLAHEAFLKAMERADTFRATGNFEAWLMRITVNHTIQHLRKSIDMVPVVEEETPDVATEETSIWEMDFTQEELLEAVQQLPVRERTVFNLYAIDNGEEVANLVKARYGLFGRGGETQLTYSMTAVMKTHLVGE